MMDYEPRCDERKETGYFWPGGYSCVDCQDQIIDEARVNEDGHADAGQADQVRAVLHWERLTARDVLRALVPHGPVKLEAIERLAGDIRRAGGVR
jgi:type IV pilus biogenesis protein CpaD/CtpE